jgi:hypothetical protein
MVEFINDQQINLTCWEAVFCRKTNWYEVDQANEIKYIPQWDSIGFELNFILFGW